MGARTRGGGFRRLAIVACGLVGAAGLAATATATATAATYTVGTKSDTTAGATCATFPSGCSLRQLIEYEDGLSSTPNPVDIIVVPAGDYSLTNGSLFIDQSVAVVGAGARNGGADISQDTSASSRVFDVQPNPTRGLTPTVVISGLSMHGGRADASNGSFGGDIRNHANLNLNEVLITGGTAQSGGGISNDEGTLIVSRSLVYNNSANSGGADSGGIQNYGHTAAGQLVVEDSTIAGNSSNLGGGIYSWCDGGTNGDCSSDGTPNTTTIINSTIAGNDGGTRNSSGGGLLATQGTIFVENSIVAGNTVASGATASNCGASSPGVITSLGHNLDDGTDCGFTAAGDLSGIDPQFAGDLQDNGGGTSTYSLSLTSPAVDAIPPNAAGCAGSDQRNTTRPQGTGCDIGAYEVLQPQAGHAFTEVVGVIEAAASSASIDWGDGTTSAPDSFDTTTGAVTGTHTYARPGVYHGSINWVNSDHITERTPFDVKVVASTQPPVVGSGQPPVVTPASTPPSVLTGVPSVGSAGTGFTGSVNPGGLPTHAVFQYGLDPKYTGGGPLAYTHSTPSQTLGADFTSHIVSASVSGLVPNALYHVRLVATNSAGTTFGPDRTFTTKAAPPPSSPSLGHTFNIKPVSGVVLVRINGQFVPLTQLRQIPQNVVINALHGTLQLITAGGGRQPAHDAAAKHGNKHKGKGKGKTQTGRFGGAVFKIKQTKRGANKGLVTISLVENAFNGAPSYATCRRHPTHDATVARALGLPRGGSKRTLQLLHSSAHGKFRTRGRYSAATVRGTKWTIADRCDGTLTHDITHSVAVTDFVRHKTIILHAGQS